MSPHAHSAQIKIIGVGGAGCNILGNMKFGTDKIVECWAMDTDSNSLKKAKTPNRIQLSGSGIGTGGSPDKARLGAEQRSDELKRVFAGAKIVFLIASLGGGTGGGAAPVVAKAAKEAGAAVFGIVFMPLENEGFARKQQAEQANLLMEKFTDWLKVVDKKMINKFKSIPADLKEAFGEIDLKINKSIKDIIV